MFDDLADLVLGARCPGCDRPGLGVCPACRAAVEAPDPFVLRDLPVAGVPPVVGAGLYEPPLDRLLSAHKDRGGLSLTPLLATRLAMAVGMVVAAVGPEVDGPLALVAVPSSPRAVRERGFDHSRALARHAARQARRQHGPGLLAAPVLRRVTAVADQSGLGRVQRASNQANSMRALPPRPGGASVAVVTDDVCTTGASLAEAARALRTAGWTVVAGAVVAHPSRCRTRPDNTP